EQQAGVLVGQQAGELFCGLPNIRPREPGAAGRILEQHRSCPAVGVAQVHGLVRAEDRRARPRLLQPPAPMLVRPHLTVVAITMMTRWPPAASQAIVPPVSSTSSSG